jgi:hypothetical protein
MTSEKKKNVRKNILKHLWKTNPDEKNQVLAMFGRLRHDFERNSSITR